MKPTNLRQQRRWNKFFDSQEYFIYKGIKIIICEGGKFMVPLKIALVEIRDHCDFSGYIAEAAKLCKEGFVDKIYLLGGDFSRLYYASKDCKYYGISTENVIINEPNLASFVKKCDEGIDLILIMTSWLSYVRAWYRFKKQPGWVWNPIEFHIVGVI